MGAPATTLLRRYGGRNGGVTAAVALVTELRGNDQALAADATKRQSHNESGDKSGDAGEKAMMVARGLGDGSCAHARPGRRA